MSPKCVRLLTSVGLAALFSLGLPSPALAQGYLGGNLIPFAVLGGTPNVTCTGASVITGDVGVSPAASITGFPAPCTDIGTLHPGDLTAANAQLNLTTAYNTLAAQLCGSTIGPDLAGLTLTPGVYCVGAAATNLSGTLILNALGNPSAAWTFQMSSSLITSSGSTVSFVNPPAGGGIGGVPTLSQWAMIALSLLLALAGALAMRSRRSQIGARSGF